MSRVTYTCIDNLFTEEEKDSILVAEINPEYMDGVRLCEHYNIDIKTGANCLVCECKRGENKSYVALLVQIYKFTNGICCSIRICIRTNKNGIW